METIETPVSEQQIKAFSNLIEEFPQWLGPLNFIILQWFFVRLSAVFNVGTGKRIGWYWQYPVIPFTKWKWHV